MQFHAINSIRWLLALTCLGLAPGGARADWLQFRGTGGHSAAEPPAHVATDGTTDVKTAAAISYPLEWDVSTGQGIAWQATLPGRGPSSPIVIGDRVIVTCSSGYHQDRLHVLCFDAQRGDKLWERQFWATGRTITHEASANAAPTPASDGEFIYAFFSSNDLVCLDLQGQLRWFRGLAYDFPRAGNDVGMSSSPVVMDGTVIVQAENQGDSFAAGINTTDGTTRWRVDRTPGANWSSPLAVRAPDGQGLALLTSDEGVTAYDVRSGSQLWQVQAAAGGISSLTALGPMVFAPADGMLALRVGAEGQPETTWTANDVQLGPASPAIHQGSIYCVTRSGVVNCLDAGTGNRKWQLRLAKSGKERGAFWASPVAAGNYLYCVNEEGIAFVVKLDVQGDQPGEIAAANEFREKIQATPALAHQALYLRSDEHLWKVAAP